MCRCDRIPLILLLFRSSDRKATWSMRIRLWESENTNLIKLLDYYHGLTTLPNVNGVWFIFSPLTNGRDDRVNVFDMIRGCQSQYRASQLGHHRDMQLWCPARSPSTFHAIRRLFYFGIGEFVLSAPTKKNVCIHILISYTPHRVGNGWLSTFQIYVLSITLTGYCTQTSILSTFGCIIVSYWVARW